MIKIEKANKNDVELITTIGKKTFIEAHSNSATKEELDTYLKQSYHPNKVLSELQDSNNHFYLIYYNNEPAGFSKITIGYENQKPLLNQVTKLERIYIYKAFYSKKLGLELVNFNINLSKQLNQKGMWLYVWIGNERAINFYTKIGFKIIGEYDFKLSETKSNPNHQMLLKY